VGPPTPPNNHEKNRELGEATPPQTPTAQALLIRTRSEASYHQAVDYLKGRRNT
jgi:hypothetical protein